MVITWLDFGGILLKTNFGKISLKNSDVLFQGQHYFGHISGMVGRIDVKRKGSALVGYWVQYVTLTLDLTHDLDLGCFKVKFWNSSISRIVGLIDVKWKGSELIWYWANCITLPFDHTHDLDLGVSRSESEIALSQEWGSRLTMNEKDVSHPFMTMILTCVTVVAWADVLDSDWGDFRRRRAVHISSFIATWCALFWNCDCQFYFAQIQNPILITMGFCIIDGNANVIFVTIMSCSRVQSFIIK